MRLMTILTRTGRCKLDNVHAGWTLNYGNGPYVGSDQPVLRYLRMDGERETWPLEPPLARMIECRINVDDGVECVISGSETKIAIRPPLPEGVTARLVYEPLVEKWRNAE